MISAWLVILVTLGVASTSVGSTFRDEFTIPGTDAQHAIDLLEARFPQQNLLTTQVVLHSSSGPIDKALISTVATSVGKIHDVHLVGPPQVSANGKTVLMQVAYSAQWSDLPTNGIAQLNSATRAAREAGVRVEYGGPVADALLAKKQSGSNADAIGLLVALVILIFVFGTVVAALIPVGMAIMGIVISVSLLTVVATMFTVGTVAPVIGVMIGLGVGIDYSLLIVTRFRQNRDAGMDIQEAIEVAMATAGSAALFAGACVMISLGGLWFARIPYVSMLGFSAALFVFVMVLVSLTLLPALLGVLGHHLDRLRVFPKRHSHTDAGGGFWYRWGHAVAKYRWPCLVASLAVLLLLAWPALGLQLGFATDGDDPTSYTQRRAYDYVSEAFGPGANSPLLITMKFAPAAKRDVAADLSAVQRILGAVKGTKGVVLAEGPLLNKTASAGVLIVIPSTEGNAPATQDLVRTLQNRVIPTATAGTPLDGNVFVGGTTAELIAVTDRISERLLWCIGFVVLAAFFLLMLVFRSILVPLKAAVMNFLSIGAAFGILVVVFQWGWGRELIGVHEMVPVVSFVPLIMFAILFGLSMDYEVFLLTRVREEYLATGDNREAVATGLAKTARVITSAAVIMISVFLVFVTNSSPTVKMLGIGLAAAVAVDATIVRLVLVPSTMELLGKANWWMPKWLDRILPRLDVDGPSELSDRSLSALATDGTSDEAAGAGSNAEG